ncbi:MAG: LCP family protein [Solirubrobacterales bacterium]|nr:LCP family protein [Solirubrobacterales bacterium]
MFEDKDHSAPKRRFIIGSVTLVVMAALVSSVVAFAARDTVLPQAIAGLAPTPTYEGGPQTVLLIGADSRKDDKKFGLKARSDTMMLVRLDPESNVTTVLSIPRDLRVKIPGRGTDKFNAAYAVGGAKLVMETVKESFGIEVQRVAEVDFGGFAQAVDAVDCVYVDVDRKYFNNNVGRVYGQQFAAINIKAGYQKLCGYRALDYVRFRYYDDDIYREARQQGFLRQAKQQVGVASLLTNVSKLTRVVNRNIKTDRWLTSGKNFQKFLRLAAESSNKPVFQVTIPNTSTPTIRAVSYVVASTSSMRKAAEVFTDGPRQKGSNYSADQSGSGEGSVPKRARRLRSLPSSMSYAKDAGRKQAFFASVGINLPVFYPTALVKGASYQDSSTRGYRMTKPDGKRVSAYRIVAKIDNLNGDYYGVQGVNWSDPPILKNPSESRRIGGRTYDLYYEGNKLALVAFQSGGASYWVANTLLRKLKEKQMLALAQSLRASG